MLENSGMGCEVVTSDRKAPKFWINLLAQEVPLKRPYLSVRPHGVIFYKTVPFIFCSTFLRAFLGIYSHPSV
jgi:hypothetical protein